MSVEYLAKEHLIIRNNERQKSITAKTDLADMMSYQLSILGAIMLQGIVDHCKIKLITDEETISFDGNCPDEAFKKIVELVHRSANVELVSDYYYTVYEWNELSQAAGPVYIKTFLENIEDKVYYSDDGSGLENIEANLDGVFYSSWYGDDNDIAEGSLYAFGEYNGKLYNGEIGYEKTDIFPEGNWLTYGGIEVDANTKGISSYPYMRKEYTRPEIWAEQEKDAEKRRITPVQLKQVEKICLEIAKLSEVSDDVEIDITGEALEYNMFSLQLKNAKDMDTFFSLYKKLESINENIVRPTEYYFDTTGDHARKMRIHMAGLDKPIFEISEIK